MRQKLAPMRRTVPPYRGTPVIVISDWVSRRIGHRKMGASLDVGDGCYGSYLVFCESHEQHQPSGRC